MASSLSIEGILQKFPEYMQSAVRGEYTNCFDACQKIYQGTAISLRQQAEALLLGNFQSETKQKIIAADKISSLALWPQIKKLKQILSELQASQWPNPSVQVTLLPYQTEQFAEKKIEQAKAGLSKADNNQLPYLDWVHGVYLLEKNFSKQCQPWMQEVTEAVRYYEICRQLSELQTVGLQKVFSENVVPKLVKLPSDIVRPLLIAYDVLLYSASDDGSCTQEQASSSKKDYAYKDSVAAVVAQNLDYRTNIQEAARELYQLTVLQEISFKQAQS
ncbi:MAG: hypothetical protein ACK59C_02725 [Holosporales bacterium]|jgi:hypothetical protein